MRTINSQSFSPRRDGGQARKLAAATRAVMEPVEARLMMSITPVTEQVAAIHASFETTPVANSGSAAEDPAVWVNPTDASRSTIIGTDKQGALNVYELDGSLIQSISGTRYNSVDVRGNLVAASNLSTNSITLFTVDPTTRKLSNVSARTINTTVGGTIYGLAMYQSSNTGKTYVFVTNRSGSVEQFELMSTSTGKTDAKSVRKFSVGSIAEGMVADDETGALYISQEDVAIWKYGAEPTDGTVRVQIDKVGTGGHLLADAEGLAMYKAADGTGYLIASSQGSNDYVVYDRQTGAYITRFDVTASSTIDGVNAAAGIEVTSLNLGGSLADGAFITQDSRNGGANQNFKVVSWGDIARGQAMPLAIDSAQNPAEAVHPSTGLVVTNPIAAVVTGLHLIDATTGQVLQILAEGSIVDLTQYSGRQLNIEASLTEQKGSVVFTTTDGSAPHIENYAPYRLISDKAVYSPTLGTNTITATTYVERYGAGPVGNVYTIDVTFVNGVEPPTTTDGPGTTVTVPSTPTGASTTVNGADSITVNWNAITGAQGYKISRSTNGTTYSQVATVTGTTFADTNLADNTKYYYKVSAYNTVGTSGLSTAVTATTAAAVDTSPIDAVGIVSGQPTARSTGTTGVLTAVTNFKAESGKTYSNLIITGEVDLRGISNVTFVNVVFDAAGASYAIRADGAGTNRLIKNSELKNMSSAAIYGGNFTAVGNYVHHSAGDGFKPTENVLIQGNYVTMLGMSDGAHADGVQIRGGNNIQIIGNFFDMPTNVTGTSSNAALFLQLDSKNVTFDSNWALGGNYTVAAYPDSYAAANVKITNNIFYSGSPRYGFGNIFDGVEWSGNLTTTGAIATPKMK